MNLNQLKYFYTVALYGSYSEASEYLYISQPSLSSAIKSLEEEFGVTLFKRHYRGVKPTAEGRILFEKCKDILSRTEQLENIMKDFGNERNKLRLGVPPMIGSLILSHIYRDFRAMYPDITLEITEDGRDELLNKLSENSLDMVFSIDNNSLDDRFSSMQVANLEIVCCVSKNAPLAKCKSVTPQMLKDVPLVLFEDGFYQTKEIKRWFSCEKVSPEIILQTRQLSTLLTMISSGIAAGFVFRELCGTNENFVAISAENPIYAGTSIIWNRDSYCLGCMEKFKNYLSTNNPFNLI